MKMHCKKLTLIVPPHRQFRQSMLGMTLLELLIALLVLGLLIGLLLLYILPSPLQRCREDAERLATYLRAISAEAQMIDGIVHAKINTSERSVKGWRTEEGIKSNQESVMI